MKLQHVRPSEVCFFRLPASQFSSFRSQCGNVLHLSDCGRFRFLNMHPLHMYSSVDAIHRFSGFDESLQCSRHSFFGHAVTCCIPSCLYVNGRVLYSFSTICTNREGVPTAAVSFYVSTKTGEISRYSTTHCETQVIFPLLVHRSYWQHV